MNIPKALIWLALLGLAVILATKVITRTAGKASAAAGL